MEKLKLDLAAIRVETFASTPAGQSDSPTSPEPSVVRWCSANYTSCADRCND